MPAAHWLSVEHVARQEVPPHAYGEQAVVEAVGQLPAPSQVADAVDVPLEQLAERHDVVE